MAYTHSRRALQVGSRGRQAQRGLRAGSPWPVLSCGPVAPLSGGSRRGSPSRFADAGRAQFLVVRAPRPPSLAGCQPAPALSLPVPASCGLGSKPVVENGQSCALISDPTLLPGISSSSSPGSWRCLSVTRTAGRGEARPENPGSSASLKVHNLDYICRVPGHACRPFVGFGDQGVGS